MNARDVRANLLAALESDLIGPFALGKPGATAAEAHASAEILPMPPSRWYFTGFLAPQTRRVPDKEDLDSRGGDLGAGSDSQAEDAGAAEPEPARPIRFPASMGLSVYLPAAPGSGEDVIDIKLSYADYDLIDIAEDTEDKKKKGWKRVPRGPIRFSIPLDQSKLKSPGIRVPEPVGLNIVGELRSTSMEGLGGDARVLSVCHPGVIETDMTGPMLKEAHWQRMLLRQTPVGRWGTPRDVANLVVFLLSRQAQYINGEDIMIDGGSTLTGAPRWYSLDYSHSQQCDWETAFGQYPYA